MITIKELGWNDGDKVAIIRGGLPKYYKLLEGEGYYPGWSMWGVKEGMELIINKVPNSSDVRLSSEEIGSGVVRWNIGEEVESILTHVTPIPVSECGYGEGDKIRLIKGKWAGFIRDVRTAKWVPTIAIPHFYEYGVAEITAVDIDGDVYIEFDGGSGYMSPELLKYFEFVGEEDVESV